MADQTDRKRLSQVQTTNLNESRINEDFVFWLKTKGLNYLLLVLVAIAGFMGFQAWKRKGDEKRQQAWAELGEAELPEALADIAERHGGVDSISLIAWLAAGDAHLRDLQNGAIGVGAPQPDGTVSPGEPLTPEQRTLALDAADRYYQNVLDRTRGKASTPGMQPFVLSALFGKAAIAESRGDLAAAGKLLEEAAKLGAETYPRYASHAKTRLETLAMLETPVRIPARAELPVRTEPAPMAPLAPFDEDELLRSLQEQLGNAPPEPEAEPQPAPEPAPEPEPAPTPGA